MEPVDLSDTLDPSLFVQLILFKVPTGVSGELALTRKRHSRRPRIYGHTGEGWWGRNNPLVLRSFRVSQNQPENSHLLIVTNKTSFSKRS